MDSAADIIICDDLHPFRLRARDKIVQDPVHCVFLINPDVAVGNQIILDRPKFEKEPPRDIVNAESAEIGQARVRADSCEFVSVNIDDHIASGILILDCLEDTGIDGSRRLDVVPAAKAGQAGLRITPGSRDAAIFLQTFHDFPDLRADADVNIRDPALEVHQGSF
jgi:hypothetical protein